MARHLADETSVAAILTFEEQDGSIKPASPNVSAEATDVVVLEAHSTSISATPSDEKDWMMFDSVKVNRCEGAIRSEASRLLFLRLESHEDA